MSAKVRVIEAVGGHRPGSIINITDDAAERLIGRGKVIPFGFAPAADSGGEEPDPAA